MTETDRLKLRLVGVARLEDDGGAMPGLASGESGGAFMPRYLNTTASTAETAV